MLREDVWSRVTNPAMRERRCLSSRVFWMCLARLRMGTRIGGILVLMRLVAIFLLTVMIGISRCLKISCNSPRPKPIYRSISTSLLTSTRQSILQVYPLVPGNAKLRQQQRQQRTSRYRRPLTSRMRRHNLTSK